MPESLSDERLLQLFNAGTLASEFSRRFGLRDNVESGLLRGRLAELHNSSRLDLLELVPEIVKAQGAKFFGACRELCLLIPQIEVDAQRLATCVASLCAAGGTDGAANEPNSAFRAWCRCHPEQARHVVRLADEGDEPAIGVLAFALEALGDLTLARGIADKHSDERLLAALAAIGRTPDSCADSRLESIQLFERLATQHPSQLVASNLVMAMGAFSEHGLAESERILIGEVFKDLVASSGGSFGAAAARALMFYARSLNSAACAALIEVCKRCVVDSPNIARELSHALSAMIEEGTHRGQAISCIESMIVDSMLSFEEFEGALRSLANGPSELLEQTVVDWLCSCHDGLGLAAASLLESDSLEGSVRELAPSSVPPSADDQKLLCRKAVAYLFFRPVAAASIMVSVLRVCGDDTAVEVVAYLERFILENYSGVREYLECVSDDPTKDRVRRAVSANDEYLKALNATPRLMELRPSERDRQASRLRDQVEMERAFRKAREASPLMSIIKHSVLLHGRTSLSLVRDKDGTQSPVEFDLKSHGVSMELPRGELVDPIGLDHLLRKLRTEKSQ